MLQVSTPLSHSSPVTRAPRTPRPAAPFWHVMGGVSLFLLYQYVAAIWRLNHTSSDMDNKFSAIARSQFIGFLIGQNALMLVAYVILAFAGTLLLQPYLSVLTRRFKIRNIILVMILGWFSAALLNDYFTLRLVDTRPYFLDEASLNNWYFHLLDLIPAGARKPSYFILFKVFPIAFISIALLWQIHRRRRGWLVAGAIAIIIGGIFGISRFSEARATAKAKSLGSPNILILSSDSLRGDRLGFSGYRPARKDGLAAGGVSPAIDRLARRSVNFETCYAPIGSTLESSTSFMTSQYPHTHGLRHMFPDKKALEEAQERTVPMAELLKEKGYDTAAIGDWCAGYYELMPLGFEHISVSSFDNFKIYMSQAVVMAHFVIPLYFDNALGYRIFPQLNSFANFVTPGVVTKRVQDRLDKVAETGRPFFWHVFYSCNHLPYRTSEPYASMFADPRYEGKHKNAVDFDIDAFTSSKSLEDKLASMPKKDVDQIRALYDGCTRQFDECVKQVLESLYGNGLGNNTIVIITGDHGDDMFEPGVTLLHGQGFNGGLQASHVPMVFHVPGAAPKSIPETVRLIDVMPTLADLTGVEKPPVWEGRSFAGWIKGTEKPEWRPFYGETGFPFMQAHVPGVERPPLRPMDEMTFIDPKNNYQFVMKPEYNDAMVAAKQRCLRTRYWKLVCTPAADGSRHFGLFHLPTDPDGRTDLADSRPEVLAPLQKALSRWIDERHESLVPEIFPGGEPE